MKKRSRKLKLNRETLRHLEPTAVSRAAGAGAGGGGTIEAGPDVQGRASLVCSGSCAFCNPTVGWTCAGCTVTQYPC